MVALGPVWGSDPPFCWLFGLLCSTHSAATIRALKSALPFALAHLLTPSIRDAAAQTAPRLNTFIEGRWLFFLEISHCSLAGKMSVNHE